MIEIYGNGPTRWTKCLWTARELGIDYKEVNVDFKDGSFGDENYQKVHPFKLVPAMKDGDFVLNESLAIMQYLCQKHPGTDLLPREGTQERALCDQWCFYSNSTLEPQQQSSFYNRFIYPDNLKNPKEVERAMVNIGRKLEVLSDEIDTREFLVGNKFTLADISMTYVLNWISMGDSIKQKNLADYMENHKEREAFPREFYER